MSEKERDRVGRKIQKNILERETGVRGNIERETAIKREREERERERERERETGVG